MKVIYILMVILFSNGLRAMDTLFIEGMEGKSFAKTELSDYKFYVAQQSIHLSANNDPTSQPSGQPSRQPSSQPSCVPTNQPTRQPMRQPTGTTTTVI